MDLTGISNGNQSVDALTSARIHELGNAAAVSSKSSGAWL